jgi:hypothetical protein
MTATAWRRTTARRRQPRVPTRHTTRVHVYAPVAGLGLGVVTPRH